MITIVIESKVDAAGTVFLEASGMPGGVAVLTPGDGLTFTETDSGLTVDVRVRHAAEEGFPTTMARVLVWLEEHGVAATPEHALDLLRVWNGWSGPVPQ